MNSGTPVASDLASGSAGGPGVAVSAIIPAYNEAGRVGETVRALARAGVADEVLVVDDGSWDGTGAAAAGAGAAVLRLPSNGGKGAALDAGAALARGRVLLFLDADLGATAGEAAALVAPVLSGEADMAVAVFPRRGGGNGGFGLTVGLARWGIRRLTGLCPVAPLSGQRALRRPLYDAAGPCAPGFGVEVGLTVDALRAGFRVVEVPVRMDHAVTGRDLAGFCHRGRQFLAVLRALLDRGLLAAVLRPGRGSAASRIGVRTGGAGGG